MKKLIVLLFVFLLPISCMAMSLTFNPNVQEARVGNIVEVDLYISGLGYYETPSIKTFALDVLWDPRKLSLTEVVFGNQLDLLETGSWTSITPEGIGSVDIYEVSFDTIDYINANQLSEFTLATLTFNTILVGSSLLGTSSEVFGFTDGIPYDIGIEMGRINVVETNTVPIPSAILLLSSGIAGLFVFRRNFIVYEK